MIKISGIILILISAICSCVFYEKKEKQYIENLNACCEFIRFIKAQIEYFSCPVDKIFAMYDKNSEIIYALSSKDRTKITSLFEKADSKILIDFFESLGKGLKNEENALCSYTIDCLEKSISVRKENYPTKIKVFRTLTFFIGFSVIILLI